MAIGEIMGMKGSQHLALTPHCLASHHDHLLFISLRSSTDICNTTRNHRAGQHNNENMGKDLAVSQRNENELVQRTNGPLSCVSCLASSFVPYIVKRCFTVWVVFVSSDRSSFSDSVLLLVRQATFFRF